MELVQRTSQVEGAIPGKLRDKESNEHFEELEIIPLRFATSRVLFPPGGDLTADPLCRSNDGIRPVLNVLQPQANECGNCSRGSWDDYGSNGRIPDCKEKMTLLFIDRNSGLPYYITVGGKSLAPMKKLKKILNKYGFMARSKGENIGIYDFATKIRPIAVKGPKGSYYILMFEPPVRVREADLGKYGPIYQQLVQRRNSAAPATSQPDGYSGEDEAVDAEYTEA